MAKMCEKSSPNQIILECDDLDYEAIQRAMSIRQRDGIFPDSGSNVSGKVVSEICRGWLDFMGLDIRNKSE